MPQVRAGKLRGIAVASSRRSPVLPDLPTLSEAGLAGFAADSWLCGHLCPLLQETCTERIIDSPERSTRSSRIALRPVATFDLLAGLPLKIESYELEGLESESSSDFTRLSSSNSGTILVT